MVLEGVWIFRSKWSTHCRLHFSPVASCTDPQTLKYSIIKINITESPQGEIMSRLFPGRAHTDVTETSLNALLLNVNSSSLRHRDQSQHRASSRPFLERLWTSSDRSERRGVTPAAGDEADQNLWRLIRLEVQVVYSSLFVSLDGNTQLNEGFSSSRTDLSSWTKRRVGSVLRHSSPGLTAPSSLSPISWKSLCVSAGQSFVVDEAVCCSRVCYCSTHWVLYNQAHTAVHGCCFLYHTDVFLQMSYMQSLRS